MPVNQRLILKKLRLYINTFMGQEALNPESKQAIENRLKFLKEDGIGVKKLFLILQTESKVNQALEILGQCQICKNEDDEDELIKLSNGIEVAFTKEEKNIIEGLISAVMPNYSQDFISKQLGAYLNIFVKPTDQNPEQAKHFESMLGIIDGEGACAGYFGLMAYAFSLTQLSKTNSAPVTNEKKAESKKLKDDLEWVMRTFDLLNQCIVIHKSSNGKIIADFMKFTVDNVTPLTPAEKQDIERIISLINTLQSKSKIFEESPPDKKSSNLSYGQGELHKSIVDTQGRSFRKHFDLSALFTKQEFKATLEKILLKTTSADEPLVISIDSPSHATGIFRANGSYYYYDANAKNGISAPCSIDQLADKVFEANSFNSKKLSPISLRIFNFLDTKPNFPNPTDLLENLTVVKENKVNFIEEKGNYSRGFSALHIAIRAGDPASVRFWLSKGADVFKTINFPEYKYPVTPVDLAKRQYQPEIENILLEHTAKLADLFSAVINGKVKVVQDLLSANKYLMKCFNFRGETLLHVAGQYDQSEVAKLLLDMGMDRNIKNTNGMPPVLPTMQYKDDKEKGTPAPQMLPSGPSKDEKENELEINKFIQLKLIKVIVEWRDHPPLQKSLFGIYSTPAKPPEEWKRLIKTFLYLVNENKNTIYKKIGNSTPETIDALLKRLYQVISSNQINLSTPSHTENILINPPKVLRDVYESFGIHQQTYADIFMQKLEGNSMPSFKL